MKWCFIAPGHRAIQVLENNVTESGGAESQIAIIASEFARLGVTVTLVYGDGSGKAATRVINRVTCIDAFPNWRRPASLLKFVTTLLQSKSDYLYANLPEDFLCLVAISRFIRRRSRFVYALASDRHCNPWRTFTYRRWFHNTLYAIGLKSADFITVQHEGQRSAVRRFTRAKLVFVPNLFQGNGLPPRRFDDASGDLIWIAFIRPPKQLAILLDAAQQLSHLNFAVVGGFDSNTLAEDEISALKGRIEGIQNLTYHGPLPRGRLLELLRQSKALVSTSAYEGFPNTMLEAWGNGVPIVSLGVDPGGVIGRQELGLVSGSFDRLLTDLETIAADGRLNDLFGRNGFNYVENRHSLRAVCDAMDEISPGLAAFCSKSLAGQRP